MEQVDTPASNRWHIGWWAAIVVWASCAGGIWLWMTAYACTGSLPVAALSAQPSLDELLVDRNDNRPTLIFFVHPKCPCTTASISELERVLVRANIASDELPTLICIATLPMQASAVWYDSPSLDTLSKLPRATVVWDHGGKLASRFGASISGTVQLFSDQGAMLFQGGITVSRGHAGESTGGDQLLACLRDPIRARAISTPIFGCPLCIEASELFASDETPSLITHTAATPSRHSVISAPRQVGQAGAEP